MYHENKAQTKDLERQYGRRSALHYLGHTLSPGEAYLEEEHDPYCDAFATVGDWIAFLIDALEPEDVERLKVDPSSRIYARVGRAKKLSDMIKARLFRSIEDLVGDVIDYDLGGSLCVFDRVAVIAGLTERLKGAVDDVPAVKNAAEWYEETSFRIYVTAAELLNAVNDDN